MRGKGNEEQRINKIIGQNLKRIRKEHGVSLKNVASILAISYQQVQKYENGSNRIAVVTLILLCKSLGNETVPLRRLNRFL